MAISPELMYAILAMDAYNRGYEPGINLSGGSSSIGDVLGMATVSSEDRSLEAVASGFYAVEYDWNGETIISYRGPTKTSPFPSGVIQGVIYGMGMAQGLGWQRMNRPAWLLIFFRR